MSRYFRLDRGLRRRRRPVPSVCRCAHRGVFARGKRKTHNRRLCVRRRALHNERRALHNSAAPTAPPNPNGPFVRHPPHSTNSDADAVDECTQTGGNYFSCRGAYSSEQDAVLKRYLWRIAQGQAAGESGYKRGGGFGDDVPHAEVPFMCQPAKRCGEKTENGEVNSAVSCLALALTAKSAAEAKAAHAKACQCDSKEGAVPGYNGSPFICDTNGRPSFIAPTMKKDEGADIVACAECQPKRGPAACQREIARLKTSDPPLATYVETKQVRRCQTPNQGPGTWSE